MKHSMMALLLLAAASHAQDRITDTLRKGVVEEESKQDLDAAIREYRAVLSQYEAARETAAMALFRMAECYRKEGKRQQAIEAYQRVTRDFPDQGKLARQSRGALQNTYQLSADESATLKRAELEAEKQEAARNNEAFQRYRQTILDEMELVQRQIKSAEQKRQLGVISDNVIDNLSEKLIRLKRDLAGFDAGIIPR